MTRNNRREPGAAFGVYIMEDRDHKKGGGGLTLTRRKGQRIVLTVLDPDGTKRLILITVQESCATTAKLTFAAHESITIDREEVWEQRNRKGAPSVAAKPGA